jgi:hypothetical protein
LLHIVVESIDFALRVGCGCHVDLSHVDCHSTAEQFFKFFEWEISGLGASESPADQQLCVITYLWKEKVYQETLDTSETDEDEVVLPYATLSTSIPYHTAGKTYSRC